ncbi:hypothetical protein [Streptomyces sp. NPDC024089]|uniref:hypothetical protein n=1 Tax=Streptomyces sp. NPDC024089 TaxID=3154328 RepID=UPI00340677C4
MVRVWPYLDEGIGGGGGSRWPLVWRKTLAYDPGGERVDTHSAEAVGGTVVRDQSVPVKEPQRCGCLVTRDGPYRACAPEAQAEVPAGRDGSGLLLGEVGEEGGGGPQRGGLSGGVEVGGDAEGGAGQGSVGVLVGGVEGEEQGGGDLPAVAFGVRPVGQEFVQVRGAVGEPLQVGAA